MSRKKIFMQDSNKLIPTVKIKWKRITNGNKKRRGVILILKIIKIGSMATSPKIKFIKLAVTEATGKISLEIVN